MASEPAEGDEGSTRQGRRRRHAHAEKKDVRMWRAINAGVGREGLRGFNVAAAEVTKSRNGYFRGNRVYFGSQRQALSG